MSQDFLKMCQRRQHIDIYTILALRFSRPANAYGHERLDVVKERSAFVIELGFLHPDQAPTPEAANAFHTDVPLASHDVCTKSVFFFHDESTYGSNEDQQTQWGERGQHMLRPVWYYGL